MISGCSKTLLICRPVVNIFEPFDLYLLNLVHGSLGVVVALKEYMILWVLRSDEQRIRSNSIQYLMTPLLDEYCKPDTVVASRGVWSKVKANLWS